MLSETYVKSCPVRPAHRVGLRCVQAFAAVIVVSAAFVPGHAQSGLLPNPLHAQSMKEVQPSWIGPLFTPNVCLSENFRTSFLRQRMPAGNSLWNMGNGKGASLITSRRIETDILAPNYVLHNDGKSLDGFGDTSIAMKYRIASGNEQHGNYIVSAQGTNTWDTGSAKNGAIAGTTAFALNGGKGFRFFDVQSALGVTLPASSGLATLGRPLAWNTAGQIHLFPRFWVEVESNSTFYIGGSKDGYKQNYVTPGLLTNKVRLPGWGEKSPTLAFGVGMQIATTHYHASDHNLLLDARIYY